MRLAAADAVRAVGPRTARKRIVSVEDDADFREVLRQWLAPSYDFTALPPGEGLIEEVESFMPELVMLDIVLPDADGLLLCRSLRGRQSLKRVPILMLSGRQDDKAFLDSIKVGATSYLDKPVTREQLTARLKELL